MDARSEDSTKDMRTSETDTDVIEYLAFISYRHSDNLEMDRKWASWLHTQLEAYEIPAELVGTTNVRGDAIPEQIYPVFRDETSLAADSNLERSISQALDRSRTLLVLCSPGAAESRYVGEEILHFKRMNRSDHILAVVIDGEPNDLIAESRGAEQCFPDALRFHLNEKGQLDPDSPSEPIAADFRLPDGSQGYTNPDTYRHELEKNGVSSREARKRAAEYETRMNMSRLKIISGILGVPLERLSERDKLYQLAKARLAAKRFRLIASVMALLAISAVTAGIYAYNHFQRAESSLQDLRNNLGFMNVDLRMLLTNYVPNEQRKPIIDHIDRVVESLLEHGDLSEEDQRQLAISLKHKANERTVSDPEQALELFTKSMQIQQSLVKARPQEVHRQHDLSVVLIDLGDFYLDRSQLIRAMTYYQEATSIRQKLLTQEPANDFWKREYSTSLNRMAIIHQKQGEYDVAITKLTISLSAAEKNFAAEPTRLQYIRDLYIVWNLIGNTYLEAENFTQAESAFQKGIQVNRQAYDYDPDNINLKRDLSVSYTNLGEILLKMNQETDAIQSFENGLMLAKELHRINPGHPLLTTDLAGNYIGLAVALEKTDPNAAMVYYLTARNTLEGVIRNGVLDDDRRDFPEIITHGIRRLEGEETEK